jgi:hypothetical protein
MFSFLQRDLPAFGRVLYPGAIPPPSPKLSAQAPAVSVSPVTPAADQVWAVKAEHPVWGSADIACVRNPSPLPDELVDVVPSLSTAEKDRARRGHLTIEVRVQTYQKQMLRDRKRLLFWLHALMESDGAIAIDGTSGLLWSHAMLADELSHDADLDIEALFALHAVLDPSHPERVSWLHSHGLEAIGAFDFDVLEPSPMLSGNAGDPCRALAFAALEGAIAPDTGRFELASPGGDVSFVPVDRFHAQASEGHRNLRDADEFHSGKRAVVCEPIGGLLGRWRTRPVPSRFLSRVSEGVVFAFSSAATDLMSERARQTLDVFQRLSGEFESLELPAGVKLGYEVDGGSSGREHLWFAVHGISGDRIDATLMNQPHDIAAMTQGQRGEHGLDRLTDWTIMSPEGPMNPRNISAARRLRETRAMWQERIDAAKRSGA